jgi:hypothetical protein
MTQEGICHADPFVPLSLDCFSNGSWMTKEELACPGRKLGFAT